MLRIKARHIQVATPEMAQQIIQLLQNGEAFEDLARSYSQCPTAIQGGSLGSFGPGHMPEELDPIFIEGEIGAIYGPVASTRGHHLIEVLSRSQ